MTTRISIFWLLFSLLLGMSLPPSARSGQRPALTLEDCGKCHAYKQKLLLSSGNSHATAVSCLDCHPHHQPTDKETKLTCASCHEGKPHFQLDDCLQCHADPHRPLVMLRDPIKPVRKECLSCHEKIGTQMQQAPGKHAQLFCNHCHNRHKEIPACLDCHQPHLANQQESDCGKCHPAHTPQVVTPKGHVPSGFCRPCHVRQTNDLAETRTNHGGIGCTYCHKGQHPSIPKCQDCHGLPHPQAIHSKYRDCLECHGDAHKLISNR